MSEESYLFRKVLITILVVLIVVIPVSIFIYNKFDNGTSILFDKMNKKALIFVTSNKCIECKSIEKELIDNNVDYYKINKDLDYNNYKIIIKRIKLDEEYVPSPSLILVENKELSVNINEFDKVNLEEFFDEYNLRR